MKRLNIPLSDVLHKRIKIWCAKNEQSVAEMVRQAVMDFLAKYEKKQKP